MKRVRYNNPAVTTTNTTTTSALVYGNTVLAVANSSALTANDFILIESVGYELCEIRKIASVDTPTQITILGGVQYPHDADVVITKLDYDQYQIKYGTVSTSMTILTTGALNYADRHNEINYLDERATALDHDYYAIYYYNSHTATGVLQVTYHNQDNFSYIKLEDFKAETGINGTLWDNYVCDALISGVEYIRSKAFVIQRLEGHQQDTVFDIQIGHDWFADWRGDRVVNKYDIIVYEFDNSSDVIYKTYLCHKIISVIQNSNKIIFSENVPSAGKTLMFEIPTAKLKFDDARYTYREVNKLIAANYLLTNTNIDVVKQAILSWTAGGTTVNKDPMSAQKAIEANQNRIDKLMNDIIVRTHIQSTKLRTRMSILNRQSYGSGSFSTPGGNTYKW